MIKVAINGLGRIGRAFLKLAEENDAIEVIAVNDLGNIENLAYLLRYDSAYGVNEHTIETSGDKIVIDGRAVLFLSQRDPLQLPWTDLDIDVVVESTGVFNTYEKSKMHLDAGAKKVVISAPVKGEPVAGIDSATVLMGVNEERLGTCQISSNGSCTTNASSPIMAILDEAFGVEKALLNTVHAYTATQPLVDGPNKKDFRKGRAGAHNIVPTSTGAAVAVTKALPKFIDKFDGIAMRVPVIAGSIADITCVLSRDTTAEEVNEALKKAAENPRWKKVFAVTDEPLVSTDILGYPHASIADLAMTRVAGGNLVKVLGWYDNEMGYTNTLIEHVIATGKSL